MSSPPSVLLVEDNPDDEACEAFRRARIGHPLEVARDCIEALNRVLDTRANERPVWMLLDLKLPHVGAGALVPLRSEISTMLVPIVVLSTSSEKADIAKGYEYGAAIW